MGLLRSAARSYALNRLARGGRRPQQRYGAYDADGRGPARRDSGFGFFGPFPSYSGRTRRGSRVRVSGCCLPIPLAMVLGTAVAVRQLLRLR